MNTGTVSSDDVIDSYQRQLSDAHHRIAILESQLVAARKAMAELDRTEPTTPGDLL